MIKYLFFFTFSFLEIVCFAQHTGFNERRYVVPLVKEKEYTTVTRIAIEANTTEHRSFLNQVMIDLAGSDHIEDIEGINIYCNADSNYLTEEKSLEAALFGSCDVASPIKGTNMKVEGNLRLDPGINYVWVGLKIRPAADVENKVAFQVSGITVNGEKLQNRQATPGIYRIASAVRRSKQDNINTSRIPGLVTASNGDLIAVYDARYESRRDLQGDIDIAISRSTDHGNSWLPVQRVIDRGTWGGLPENFNGVSDPCILVDKKTGTLFIAGLWMHGVLDEKGHWIEGLTDSSKQWNHQWRDHGSQSGFDVKQTSQFLMVKSTDNGKTWSEPVNLTPMCKKKEWWLWAPAPGRGFTMDDGTLVLPTQGRDATGKAFSGITYSKDGGKTWKTGNAAVATSTTECAAVQLTDGSIMLNMRTNANKGITGEGNGRSVAITKDLGKTWTEHATSRKALPEPVCMFSLFKHEYTSANESRKTVLLFLNPNSTTKRHRMTLKVSYDDGKTWPPEKYILLDELNGSGYSCITSVDNNTIGVIYEGSQAQLVFQKIKLKEIIN
ncbi:MAG: exo-alpha-sialidase [Niabella sp.]